MSKSQTIPGSHRQTESTTGLVEKFPVVAYVAGAFPVRSETFVYREVRALRQRGWLIHIVSLNRPQDIDAMPAPDLAAGLIRVYGALLVTIACGMAELLRHPLRSARTLGMAIGDAICPTETLRLGGRLKLFPQAVASLGVAWRLRGRAVDHIHCHFAHSPTTIGMYAAAQLGITFSFTGHANDIFERRALLRKKLVRATFVSCISRWHREFYQSVQADVEGRYRVIRCGVDTDEWNLAPRRERSDRASPLRVLTVCRLVEKKGVDVLIRALSRFGQRSGRAWTLTVVGTGPERERLQHLTNQLGCVDRVSWFGPAENDRVRTLMMSADVVALGCRVDQRGDRDGVPVVLMEAMASGVPLITGDLPAIRELVIHGKTGMCAGAEDVEAFADRFAELDDHPMLAHELSIQGRKHVVEEFSLSRNIPRLELAMRGACSRLHAVERLRVAYLNTRYPSLSHTFIEREVRAVRAAGAEVHTFSVRRPTKDDLLGPDHQAAARETFYLLDGARSMCALLLSGLSRPHALLRSLWKASRLSPPGLNNFLLHAIYSLEGARLAVEMRRRGLRHVHVHMANNGAMVALLATVFDRGLTYSLSIHGSAEFFQVVMWRLKQKAERALFVRCISDFCRAQVMAWTDPHSWERYHIVHCAVDTEVFRPTQRHSDGPLRIITVGRLDPIKGYPQLLEACRKLSDVGIEWHLDMVGSGPLRGWLERSAKELGLSDGITFSGAVGQDRVQEHLDRADVMVISSFMEGVPVVLMEAMAKGMTVIATRVGGIPELVDDGVNGLLVSPGSIDALAAALHRVGAHRELLAQFAEPAREKIVREFSLQKLGPQMAELLSRYCGQQPVSRLNEEDIGRAVAMPESEQPTIGRFRPSVNHQVLIVPPRGEPKPEAQVLHA